MSTTRTKTKAKDPNAEPEHAIPGRFSFDEVYGSLTGDEEDLLYDAYQTEVTTLLAEARGSKALRACLFVLHVRDGAKPVDAKKAAQAMPFRDLDAYFVAGEHDADPEDPESGEDDGGPSSEPKTTPRSASSSDSTQPSTAA